MTETRRVVWSEGLFLRPQHFQQLERSIDARVTARLAGLAGVAPVAWGFTLLRLDGAALASGHVALAAARGVLPDGTPFSLPEDAPLPPPLEWRDDRRDRLVHLAVPFARPGLREFAFPGTPEAADARWLARDHAVADSVLADTEPAELALADLQVRLVDEDAPAAGLCRLPVARVLERRPGGAVVLDADWIAPSLDCRAVAPLQALLLEARQLVRHRADGLAARRAGGASAGAGLDAAELLLLQVVNRYDALLGHLATREAVSPETLHAVLAQAVGECATFDERRGRRAGALPPWRHDDPRSSLGPLLAELRLLLADATQPQAVPVPLQPRAAGLWTALVPDADLLHHASFILVAAADVPQDVLRRRLPGQLKIGPPDRLRDLVRQQLPAIGLQPLSVAPPRLPYYAGHGYFELERGSPLWPQLEPARVIALHAAGDLPSLRLELWAVRP